MRCVGQQLCTTGRAAAENELLHLPEVGLLLCRDPVRRPEVRQDQAAFTLRPSDGCLASGIGTGQRRATALPSGRSAIHDEAYDASRPLVSEPLSTPAVGDSCDMVELPPAPTSQAGRCTRLRQHDGSATS